MTASLVGQSNARVRDGRGALVHACHLSDDARARVFAVAPEPFARDALREVLAPALGATLYVPATRASLGEDLIGMTSYGCLSAVVDLEDSVPDVSVESASRRVIDVLQGLSATVAPLPLIFLRPRTAEHLAHLLDGLGTAADVVSGVVAPKYLPGDDGWWRVAGVESRRRGGPFWVMPVVEHECFARPSTRQGAIEELLADLGAHRESLGIRVGGTDLSGRLGLRRDRRTTIHELRPVADVIADLVATSALDPEPWVITGPVWEFLDAASEPGLERETRADLATGLLGKSVIHPAHVPVVHAGLAVSWADHADAVRILGLPGGGAFRSPGGDRMSEAAPHSAWAVRILARARSFGVLRPGSGTDELLAVSRRQRRR